MADNISNIVDPVVFGDLDKLINKLVDVETEIQTINGKTISVTVDLKGAETITQLNTAIQQHQITIEKITAAKEQDAQATNQLNAANMQYGATVTGNVRLLVEQKAELSDVNNRIKELTNNQYSSNTAYIKAQNEIVRLTEKQILLKQAISENSKALKDSVVQVNNVSNSFTVLGVNVESTFARMAVRMVAMQLLFAPIIAGIGSLIEYFTALDEKQKDAADSLEEYRKTASNLNTEIKSAVALDKSHASAVINSLLAQGNSVDATILLYQKLQSMYPHMLDDLTEQQKKQKDSIALNDAQISQIKKLSEANELLGKIKSETAQKDNALKTQNELQSRLDQVYNSTPKNSPERKIMDLLRGGTDTKNISNDLKDAVDLKNVSKWVEFETIWKSIHTNADATKDAIYKLDASITSATQKYYNLMHVDPDKPKKVKDTTRSAFSAELKDEEAEYQKHLAKLQEAYDNSNHIIGVDDVNKKEGERIYAENHYKRLLEIFKKYTGKLHEDKGMMEAREKQALADKLNVENAANEAERKIALEIQKRHEKAAEQMNADIAKMGEQRQKIEELARQASDIRKAASEHKAYAQGANPFLEALGFDNDFKETQKAFDTQIEQAREKLADLEELRSQAIGKGDPTKVGGINVEMSKQTTDIAKLEADKQKSIDDKIIDAKKQAAEKAIELAKQTAEAVTAIQNNAYAHQQELLDIEGRNIQIQAQQKIQSINASTGYAIQKQNQLSLVNAQATAKENEIEAKKRHLAVEQARFNRAAAEASIVANTAAAIVKAMVNPGWPEAIPIMAAEAAIGAVQFAAASSAPIPSYATGTDNHPGGLAIVGEAGQREYIQTPSGDNFWSKSEATLLDLPKHSTVTPMDQMSKFASSTMSNGRDASIMLNQDAILRSEAMYKYIADKIENSIEEQTDKIVTGMYQSMGKQPNYDRQIHFEVMKGNQFKNTKRI